jgi:hypothetical protein
VIRYLGLTPSGLHFSLTGRTVSLSVAKLLRVTITMMKNGMTSAPPWLGSWKKWEWNMKTSTKETIIYGIKATLLWTFMWTMAYAFLQAENIGGLIVWMLLILFVAMVRNND